VTAHPDVAAVVLAAGLGTRFRSSRAKVMHHVAGRSMLGHVLEALRPLGLAQVVVVVGHDAEQVEAEARSRGIPNLVTARQPEQNGTGHALECAYPSLRDDIKRVLIVNGDHPLMTPTTFDALLAEDRVPLVLLTTDLEDPTGYGRVMREGVRIVEIIEEADASHAQRAITEVNVGVYLFDRDIAAQALASLSPDNAQGELYLTDVVGILTHEGHTAIAVHADAEEVQGVNDRAQLADADAILRERVLTALLAAGVTIVDPSTTYVGADVVVGRDTVLLPGTHLEGTTTIGENATIGPYTRLVDARVADGATVSMSVVLGAEIGPRANVGPFTYLRPGTTLDADTKAGAFVELKQTTVGEGSKVPHLSYLGDATVGRYVNIGAGTITCNYDGFEKFATVVEDGAFVGSDTMLVAPVTVGEGAVTGAGSAITEDVPPGSLAVERAGQTVVDGWADARREQHGGDVRPWADGAGAPAEDD